MRASGAAGSSSRTMRLTTLTIDSGSPCVLVTRFMSAGQQYALSPDCACGKYIAGGGSTRNPPSRTSFTTPTTVAHGEVGFSIFTVPPIALFPGQSFFSMVSLTIATSAAPLRSASVNRRPRASCIRIVSKNPGETCIGIAAGDAATDVIGAPSTRIDHMLHPSRTGSSPFPQSAHPRFHARAREWTDTGKPRDHPDTVSREDSRAL